VRPPCLSCLVSASQGTRFFFKKKRSDPPTDSEDYCTSRKHEAATDQTELQSRSTRTVGLLHSALGRFVHCHPVRYQPPPNGAFSLRTNQPPVISQQYFPLTTNQHQPSATSQTNKLIMISICSLTLNRACLHRGTNQQARYQQPLVIQAAKREVGQN
jgi:hypothetical protein